MGYDYGWSPYVPVAERRAKALKKMAKLRKQGKVIQPVEIEGRTIAKSFWGKAWCDHLESFSDYSNRLPRGMRYVRNGSVCHLEIEKGRIEAIVSGSELYKVKIDIKPLKPVLWKPIKQHCCGKIGSMLELLQGRLSDQVMSIVTDQNNGLMPLPKEISLKCSCPDWAVMCKHVAAVMYGIGNRLDSMPELLFTLRGVNADELITDDITLPMSDTSAGGSIIADDQLSDIFGIEMDSEILVEQTESKLTAMKKRKSKRNGDSERKVKDTIVKSAKPKRKTRKKVKTVLRSKANIETAKTSDTYPRLYKLPSLRPTGNSVKKLRKKLGLSASEFAERLGVSSATVYNWEKQSGSLNLQERSLTALAQLHQEL
ncbi:MAG: helix-turn-helix domain-containing protein [Phycisphaerae bacterium]|nr:helix-turn-helix domain-containing protein [Phycisphaerae bacterium]